MSRVAPFFIGFTTAAFLVAVTLLLALSGMPARAAGCTSGSLVKGSFAAVYYCGADGKRYVFTNDKVYFSWYTDFSTVVNVSDAELAAIAIGGNVTYRPGVRMVKIQSDPRVYAVGRGGALRWVKTEAAATTLFGADWNKKVDDIADAFFVNYQLGADIVLASDFNPSSERDANPSINDDKRLAVTTPAPTNTNTNTNTNAPPLTCANACGLANACSAGVCRSIPGPSVFKVQAITVDSADVCFMGDAYTSGPGCSVAGVMFSDNANLVAIKPRDKYLYAGKQELCGRAVVNAQDRNRITNELLTFGNAVSTATQNRLSANVTETHLTGEFTLSRVAGTCDWWMAPSDLRDRFASSLDNSTDSVMVTSSRTFDFGAVGSPDTGTVDQSGGIAGAGYSYIVKEAENVANSRPLSSIYKGVFEEQYASLFTLGVSDPNASTVTGNHCRNNKKDLDETGLDCGGLTCAVCR